ncbi:MAG: dTMP kinase [Endomicrobium sp.]|jgi:dTMP kinase|nr:dTMP kinase [Endomicrobium sp.]
MTDRKKHIFITIEGGEGSGKTTQSLLLKEYLERNDYEVFLTREPGPDASVLAEIIRNIILEPTSNLVPLSELFLFEAARAHQVKKFIYPALKAGKIVVCDRFVDSTVAYQGYGRKLSLKLIDELNSAASFGLEPTLTLYLDIMPSIGLNRAKEANRKSYGGYGDRIEKESIKFHNDVRKGYLKRAVKCSKRIKIVKTQETPEKTHALIKGIVDKVL